MNINDWHNETIGQKVVKALQKNEFDAVYFASAADAAEHVLKHISAGDVVGFGGSVTMKELGIPEKALEKGAKILDHNKDGLSPEEKDSIRRQQLISDVFLCSANAVTLDGCIVNIDGVGNRVAAMTYGPKKVVIVAGINKIAKDVHAAFQRIRSVASPKNNKRLNLPNPCTASGTCMDCQAKTRTCRIYSVMKKKPMSSDITVVIVGEQLGY